MRELVAQFLSKSLSRRSFVNRLVGVGVSLPAARSLAASLTPAVQSESGVGEDLKIFEGTGGEAFAEQLIASGVKYVFGNPGSKDSFFYDALVDRTQLTYILTPHEGPGAAMATGYVQASLDPSLRSHLRDLEFRLPGKRDSNRDHRPRKGGSPVAGPTESKGGGTSSQGASRVRSAAHVRWG